MVILRGGRRNLLSLHGASALGTPQIFNELLVQPWALHLDSNKESKADEP